MGGGRAGGRFRVMGGWRRHLYLALTLSGLVLAPTAHALRCAGGLIAVGDHAVVVRERCGAPEWIGARLVHPYVLDYAAESPGRRIVRYLPVPTEVEEWVYDLGSRRFLQLLRFERGRLIEIESLPKPR